MNTMNLVNTRKKSLFAVLTALGAVSAPVLAPYAQGFINSNPTLATAVSTVALILAYIAPSPVVKNGKS